MSEQTQNNQQTLVIGLVIVAALLAAIVGVLVYQQSTSIPSPSVQQAQPATTPGTANNAATQQQADVPFDAKTATKVPAGTEPEAFVKSYYEACKKGDYAAAFAMLPKDKQASYGDAKSFGEQLKGYGISGYELEAAKIKGDTAEITAWQKTPMGSFGYTWVLVKQGGSWLVKSRNQSGMK